MKLYIINQGLWHFCPGRAKIDSLFYKRKNYLYCPICMKKIPDWLALPFLDRLASKSNYTFISLAKEGQAKDYGITRLKKSKISRD